MTVTGTVFLQVSQSNISESVHGTLSVESHPHMCEHVPHFILFFRGTFFKYIFSGLRVLKHEFFQVRHFCKLKKILLYNDCFFPMNQVGAKLSHARAKFSLVRYVNKYEIEVIVRVQYLFGCCWVVGWTELNKYNAKSAFT